MTTYSLEVVLTDMIAPACTNMLYTLAEMVLWLYQSPYLNERKGLTRITNLVRTLYEFLDAQATWIGWMYGYPAIRDTTAKYAHCDVVLLNVWRAIKSGSAHICRTIVAPTRLLTISLTKAITSSPHIPKNNDGMLSKLVCVVVKPRLRRESVRYVCGGTTGTMRRPNIVSGAAQLWVNILSYPCELGRGRRGAKASSL